MNALVLAQDTSVPKQDASIAGDLYADVEQEATPDWKPTLTTTVKPAVAELGEHSDLWQRGGLAVVSVAQGRDALERLFESVYRETEAGVPGHVIETGSDFIEAADGGPRGWSEGPL